MSDNFLKPVYSWIIIFVVSAGMVLFVFYQNRQIDFETKNMVREMTASKIVSVRPKTRVIIDYGNGKKRVFEGAVIKGMNLQDVFWGIEYSAGIVFGVRNREIESIDCVKSRPPKKWNYYINNNIKQDDNPLDKEIGAGDKIFLVYE